MKLLDYTISRDGSFSTCTYNGEEVEELYISSSATPDNLYLSINSTSNGFCLGMDDCIDCGLVDFAVENFRYFQEIGADECIDRIKHLAEEWDLTVEELSFLA